MAKVKDRWTSDGARFMKQLDELKQLQVCIGFQSGDKKRKPGEQDGKKKSAERDVTNLDIAMWNELGTSTSPSRPFMRNSIDRHVDVIRAAAAKQIQALSSGASARQVLTMMGNIQKGLMQHEIMTGQFAPNAEITIHGGWMRSKKTGKRFYVQGKKSDRPLVHTGQLRKSVHFVIKPKGGG